MSHNPAYPDTDKTICLDFDGVIHNDDKGYHDGTIYGEPTEGCEQALREITEMGFDIIICSTKAREDRPLVDGKTGIELINEWLCEHDLCEYIDDVISVKPPAFIYVDDKGWHFDKNNASQAWSYLKNIIFARKIL